MTIKLITDDVEKSIIELLESNISSNKISRSADVSLSAISRIRSGNIDLQNMRWHTIKRLYEFATHSKG